MKVGLLHCLTSWFFIVLKLVKVKLVHRLIPPTRIFIVLVLSLIRYPFTTFQNFCIVLKLVKLNLIHRPIPSSRILIILILFLVLLPGFFNVLKLVKVKQVHLPIPLSRIFIVFILFPVHYSIPASQIIVWCWN